MPEKKTTQRARRDRRQGKKASTQAGNYVAEEVRHKKSGKHPVKNKKQAVAIGLSKARRAGVKVPKKRSSTKSASAKRSTASKKPTARRSTRKTTRRTGTSGKTGRKGSSRSKSSSSARRTKKSGSTRKSRSSR